MVVFIRNRAGKPARFLMQRYAKVCKGKHPTDILCNVLKGVKKNER